MVVSASILDKRPINVSKLETIVEINCAFQNSEIMNIEKNISSFEDGFLSKINILNQLLSEKNILEQSGSEKNILISKI